MCSWVALSPSRPAPVLWTGTVWGDVAMATVTEHRPAPELLRKLSGGPLALDPLQTRVSEKGSRPRA